MQQFAELEKGCKARRRLAKHNTQCWVVNWGWIACGSCCGLETFGQGEEA